MALYLLACKPRVEMSRPRRDPNSVPRFAAVVQQWQRQWRGERRGRRGEDEDEVTDTLSTATFAGHNTQHLTRLAMERPRDQQNRAEQQRHKMNTQILNTDTGVSVGAVSEQEVLLQVQALANVQVFCGSPRRDGPTNLS